LRACGGRSAARAVLHVFVVFLLVFVFDPFCFRVLVGRGFGQSAAEVRTVHGQADSPRPPRGQSVFQGSLLEVLLAFSDSPRLRPNSPSTRADSPSDLAGQSAWPVRTVCPSWPDSTPEPGSFVPWYDSSLTSSVHPRVVQGIVPKT
jgi:hypothetical protein